MKKFLILSFCLALWSTGSSAGTLDFPDTLFFETEKYFEYFVKKPPFEPLTPSALAAQVRKADALTERLRELTQKRISLILSYQNVLGLSTYSTLEEAFGDSTPVLEKRDYYLNRIRKVDEDLLKGINSFWTQLVSSLEAGSLVPSEWVESVRQEIQGLSAEINQELTFIDSFFEDSEIESSTPTGLETADFVRNQFGLESYLRRSARHEMGAKSSEKTFRNKASRAAFRKGGKKIRIALGF